MVPEDVARALLNGVRKGEYSLYCGDLGGFFLGRTSKGLTPSSTPLFDLLIAPLLALFGWGLSPVGGLCRAAAAFPSSRAGWVGQRGRRGGEKGAVARAPVSLQVPLIGTGDLAVCRGKAEYGPVISGSFPVSLHAARRVDGYYYHWAVCGCKDDGSGRFGSRVCCVCVCVTLCHSLCVCHGLCMSFGQTRRGEGGGGRRGHTLA